MKVSGQLQTWLLYPQYSLDRRLGGPQSWSGHTDGKEKNHFCQESNPSRSAHSLVIILTELTQLPEYNADNIKFTNFLLSSDCVQLFIFFYSLQQPHCAPNVAWATLADSTNFLVLYCIVSM
jgi:hypothetical protein